MVKAGLDSGNCDGYRVLEFPKIAVKQSAFRSSHIALPRLAIEGPQGLGQVKTAREAQAQVLQMGQLTQITAQDP